jgi:accessory colonization factor AcfC
MPRFRGFVAPVLLGLSAYAHASDGVAVYGPGGPAPAIREAAEVFGKLQGIEVRVTAGPTTKWASDLPRDGDVVYSGSEAMMSDFISRFGDTLVPATLRLLYLRPAGILVRPGNPQHIHGFHDLLRPGVNVMVVSGAGQVGLWEDIAGRDGDIEVLRAFRANVTHFAGNSAEAVHAWKSDPSIQAWIIFPIWSIANPGLAEVVPLEERYRLYRDCGVILTRKGLSDAHAQGFVRFLESPAGKKIFEKHGWTERASAR